MRWVWATRSWPSSCCASVTCQAVSQEGKSILLSPSSCLSWSRPVPGAGALAGLRRRTIQETRCPIGPCRDENLTPSQVRWLVVGLIILVGIGGFFRFASLGYAEFQGDEARATLRAAAVIQGYEDVLMIHKKGPGEILVPTAIFAAAGRLDEVSGRLLFAIANLGSLVAVFLLGWRLLGPIAGWVAALLLAIDGYFVAYARFVQYQSVVLLIAALAVMIAYRIYKRPKAVTEYLLLMAILLGGGLLFHYDVALAALPVSFLLLAAAWQKRLAWRDLLRATVPAIAAGVAITAVFYVPFVRSPYFEPILYYLVSKRLGGDAQSFPYNNLADTFVRTSRYSSSYYLIFMASMVIVALCLAYGRGLRRPWNVVACAAVVGTACVAVWQPSWLTVGGTDYTFVPFAVAMMVVWVLPKIPTEEKTIWIWFGAPMVAALFLISNPKTHVYVFFMPWALLVGWALDQGWQAVRQRVGRRSAMAVGAAGVAVAVGVFGYYTYLLFVYNKVEVLIHWQDAHPTLYWTPFTTPASGALYGFPVANGWKVASMLYQNGQIQGNYETNDPLDWTSLWYTRGQQRCGSTADWYFMVENLELVEKRREATEDLIKEQGFVKTGQVEVNGSPHMGIYRRVANQGDAQGQVATYPLAAYAAAFDSSMTPDFPLAYPVIRPQIDEALHVNFDNQVWLENYKIEYAQPLKPGDTFRLTLYWRAQQDIDRSYTVFNQVLDSNGGKIAQKDSRPVCDRSVTTGWAPGELVVDTHEIQVAGDAASGVYPLITGMYQSDTLDRLPVLDASGQAVDTAVHLTDLVVEGK